MRAWGLCLKQSSGGPMAQCIRSLRQEALQQQNGCCFYCKQAVWEDNPLLFSEVHELPHRLAKWLQSTAEHLHARCDGGRDCRGNVVAACLWCNTRRHLGRTHRAPEADAYGVWVRRVVAAGKWHPVIEHRNFLCKLQARTAQVPPKWPTPTPQSCLSR